MAKRFTDTGKWDDAWFFGLTQPEKLFWGYVLDRCDHAGIWQANWSLVQVYVGGEVDRDKFKERLLPISEDRVFIPKFIEFQYGKLNQDNKTHAGVIKILQKYGLDAYVSPGKKIVPHGFPGIPKDSLGSSGKFRDSRDYSVGPKDKDKETETDTDTETALDQDKAKDTDKAIPSGAGAE